MSVQLSEGLGLPTRQAPVFPDGVNDPGYSRRIMCWFQARQLRARPERLSGVVHECEVSAGDSEHAVDVVGVWRLVRLRPSARVEAIAEAAPSPCAAPSSEQRVARAFRRRDQARSRAHLPRRSALVAVDLAARQRLPSRVTAPRPSVRGPRHGHAFVWPRAHRGHVGRSRGGGSATSAHSSISVENDPALVERRAEAAAVLSLLDAVQPRHVHVATDRAFEAHSELDRGVGAVIRRARPAGPGRTRACRRRARPSHRAPLGGRWARSAARAAAPRAVASAPPRIGARPR